MGRTSRSGSVDTELLWSREVRFYSHWHALKILTVSMAMRLHESSDWLWAWEPGTEGVKHFLCISIELEILQENQSILFGLVRGFFTIFSCFLIPSVSPELWVRGLSTGRTKLEATSRASPAFVYSNSTLSKGGGLVKLANDLSNYSVGRQSYHVIFISQHY